MAVHLLKMGAGFESYCLCIYGCTSGPIPVKFNLDFENLLAFLFTSSAAKENISWRQIIEKEVYVVKFDSYFC